MQEHRKGTKIRLHGRRPRTFAVAAAVAAIALAPLRASGAVGDVVSFADPFVITQARTPYGDPDFDFDLTYGDLPALIAKSAASTSSDGPGNKASAQALANTDGALGFSAKASAFTNPWSSSPSYAIAQSAMAFRAQDPIGRGRVKAIFEFSGIASAGDPTPYVDHTQAHFWIEVGDWGQIGQARHDEDRTRLLAFPRLLVPSVIGAAGIHSRSHHGSSSEVSIYAHGVDIHSETPPGAFHYGKQIVMNLPVGVLQVVHLGVSVRGNGAVFLDPVILPHPDNPEATVTLLGAHDPTSPPIVFPSEAELAAAGIDVGPLHEMGLLDEVPPPCDGGAAISRPKLVMTSDASDRAKLRFQGKLALPLPLDPPFDPVARGARIRVEDASGEVILDETLPAGARNPATSVGWRHDAARGRWIFTRPGSPGIRHLVLKRAGASGNVVRFAARAHLPSTPVPGPDRLPLQGTVVIDPPAASNGQCGEARFGGETPAIACPIHLGTRLVCR